MESHVSKIFFMDLDPIINYLENSKLSAGNTTIKKATNGTTNNNLSSVSSQSSMNLAPKNCIIGGSQLQLNGDGKSTLSRKAQKLAQKAVHKLTIGGSELSNSASALYSMFTSGAETQNGTNGGGGGIYAETSSLYNLGFNQPQIFYGVRFLVFKLVFL